MKNAEPPITAMPAANPSSPSTKLMAFMVSTRMKTVSPIWIGSLPTGIHPTGMASTRMPCRATSAAAPT
jgi:hypothetical protein